MTNNLIDKSFGTILTKHSAQGTIFLLIQHLNGNWGFPKGRPEPGESALDAAIRECREEVGLTNLKLLFEEPLREQFTFQRQGAAEPVMRQIEYFLAEVGENEAVSIQPTEIRAYAWLPYREALRRLGHAEGKATLRQAGMRLTGLTV